jgi:hypothetical protein
MIRLLVFVACLSASRLAHATGPLGPNGSPIRTSDYAIDLAAGPILAGPRALGLGGAYVAIAEGVDGNLQNPASPAVRAAWSRSHVDYDLAFGLVFPGSLSKTDYFNTGRGRTDLRRSNQGEFALLAPIGNLQVGPWGVGLGLEVQRYGLQRRPDPTLGGNDEVVRGQISVIRTYLARAVDDGQLVGGLGLNVTALDVTTANEIFTRNGNVFTTRGLSFEGGLLWRPSELPFRVGVALRAPVLTEVDARGNAVAGDIVLGEGADAIWMPRRVKRPWSSDIGFALSLGPRPLNPEWLDPVVVLRRIDRYLERRDAARERRVERAALRGPDELARVEQEAEREAEEDDEYRDQQADRLYRLLGRRYKTLSRRYFLISTSLHADGDVAHAVGIESFLQGRTDRSGESVSLSPRFGVETEPIANWLQVRAGTYLEPSRFRGTAPRKHATFGSTVRLFDWSLFGLLDDDSSLAASGAVDFGREYFGWAVSLGIWH